MAHEPKNHFWHFERDQFLYQLKKLENRHQRDEMPSEAEINHVKGLRETALALNEHMLELQGQMGSIGDQMAIGGSTWTKLKKLKNNFEIQSSEKLYLIPHSVDAMDQILDQKIDDIERVRYISQNEGRVFTSHF